MICPNCLGFGYIFNQAGKDNFCEACAGYGSISVPPWKAYGEKMKAWRLVHSLSLRDAAEKYGIDFSNLSKMERGLIKPKCYWK